MSLFELAETKLIQENKNYTFNDVIDYARRIRKWIDKYPTIAKRILTNKPISSQLKYKYKKQGINL